MKKKVKDLIKTLPTWIKPLIYLGYNFIKEAHIFIVHSTTIIYLKLAGDSNKNLKLHLGCGTNIIPTWTNIDIKKFADLRLDIRRHFPFDNNSVSTIFVEHLFEHFEKDELIEILEECYRVLNKSGELTFSAPDFEAIFKSYFSKNREVFNSYKNDLKRFDNIEWVFGNDWEALDFLARQNSEHKYMYTYVDFKKLLHRAGFSKVKKRAWLPKLDSKERKNFSIFVLAKKKLK